MTSKKSATVTPKKPNNKLASKKPANPFADYKAKNKLTNRGLSSRLGVNLLYAGYLVAGKKLDLKISTIKHLSSKVGLKPTAVFEYFA